MWFLTRKEAKLSESSALEWRAEESEEFMKKARPKPEGELRAEYKRSDFAGPMVRGKYAKRLRKSSNIVVLKPEVAAAFPHGEAVNNALQSLIEVARTTTRLAKHSCGAADTRR